MPPIKVHSDSAPTPAVAIDSVDELSEELVVARMGEAISAAASERREKVGEDARQAARRAAVDIASAALRASSAETAAHSDEVEVIAEGIARRLGISGPKLEDVLVTARLHDIGKLGIPAQILKKPGALTEPEWALIYRHTIIGEQILVAVPELRGAAHLVRHSHERWDGSGYPDGLAGEEIPIGSRIVFCADAFHAIRSDRPYRAGRSAGEALAEIRACAGTQFDPDVVDALEALAGELRAATNGHRPKTMRGRRLLALLLIVSVGSCSSALARSGLMPEANASGSAAAETASGPAALEAGAQPGSLAAAGIDSASADGADSLGADQEARSTTSFGLLTSLPAPLIVPGAALAAVPATDSPDAGVTAGEPGSVDPPGVRDHGKGEGTGKGNGKGRGAELGRGHDEDLTRGKSGEAAQGDGNGIAKKANSESAGGDDGPGSANGAASGNSGRSNSGRSKSAKTSAARGKSGHTSSGHSSTGHAGGASATAPKPPKPATPDSGGSPSTGQGSGGSLPGGNSGSGNTGSGNSGGNAPPPGSSNPAGGGTAGGSGSGHH